MLPFLKLTCCDCMAMDLWRLILTYYTKDQLKVYTKEKNLPFGNQQQREITPFIVDAKSLRFDGTLLSRDGPEKI